MNMDNLIREFVSTGDIDGISIHIYCELLEYAKIFAPSVYNELSEAQFFSAYHY